VPVSLSLQAEIRERQANNPGVSLIFSNQVLGPNQHLLRIVKRIGKRIGLNCDLHTFRRTFATLYSKTSGVTIQSIQRLLGHKDIKTTMAYLGVDDFRSSEFRQAVESTFAAFV
jgi:integrase